MLGVAGLMWHGTAWHGVANFVQAEATVHACCLGGGYWLSWCLLLGTPSGRLCRRSYAQINSMHPPLLAELMQLMEAAGFAARVALQRKADEEVLTILHFWRRPSADGGHATQQQQQMEEQQQDQPEQQQWEPSHSAAAQAKPHGQQQAAEGRAACLQHDKTGQQLAEFFSTVGLADQPGQA